MDLKIWSKTFRICSRLTRLFIQIIFGGLSESSCRSHVCNVRQTSLRCSKACSVSLELQWPRSLRSDLKMSLLRDFEAARQQLLTTYVVKLSFWAQAPCAVVGLAHTDPAVRMKSLITCLRSGSSRPKIQLLRVHEEATRAFLVADVVCGSPSCTPRGCTRSVISAG